MALDRAVQAAGSRFEALRAIRFAVVSDQIIRRQAGRHPGAEGRGAR